MPHKTRAELRREAVAYFDLAQRARTAGVKVTLNDAVSDESIAALTARVEHAEALLDAQGGRSPLGPYVPQVAGELTPPRCCPARRAAPEDCVKTPRYVVVETTGYRIYLPVRTTAGGTSPPNVTVSVLDRLWGYREVGCWNSDDPAAGIGRYTGRARARELAEAHAARLNAAHEAHLAEVAA